MSNGKKKLYTQDYPFLGYKNYEKTLAPDVLDIVKNKFTQKPFEADTSNQNSGGYLCKVCLSPCFRVEDKFDSGCGWPSFDDCIDESLIVCLDEDKIRDEVLCKRCHSHLGHVFTGENFTSKNIRYCINYKSLEYIRKDECLSKGSFAQAIFAAGCFWGVESLFQKKDGVVKTKVGYIGGNVSNPTYEDICSGNTGHYEAIKIVYDINKIDYKALCKYFFEIHDPYQLDGQGPDKGSQYLSAIFTQDSQEIEQIDCLIDKLSEQAKVSTKVLDLGVFWEAEDYHQDYYNKTGKVPYCHFYTKRF